MRHPTDPTIIGMVIKTFTDVIISQRIHRVGRQPWCYRCLPHDVSTLRFITWTYYYNRQHSYRRMLIAQEKLPTRGSKLERRSLAYSVKHGLALLNLTCWPAACERATPLLWRRADEVQRRFVPYRQEDTSAEAARSKWTVRSTLMLPTVDRVSTLGFSRGAAPLASYRTW